METRKVPEAAEPGKFTNCNNSDNDNNNNNNKTLPSLSPAHFDKNVFPKLHEKFAVSGSVLPWGLVSK